MWKAALIGAAVGFVLILIVTVVFPLCDPCITLLLGAGVGFLAATWEHRPTPGGSATVGAQAGAIAMGGSLVGQMIAAVIQAVRTDEEAVASFIEFYERLGMPNPGLDLQTYRLYGLGGNCMCALVGLVLGAGMGALGGLLWYQMAGKDRVAAPPPQEPEPSLSQDVDQAA